MKVVKTKCRKRMSDDMLNACLSVFINGPAVKNSRQLVKRAVTNCVSKKSKRKLPPSKVSRRKQDERNTQDVPVEQVEEQVQQKK